jgi:hypothetical protein
MSTQVILDKKLDSNFLSSRNVIWAGWRLQRVVYLDQFEMFLEHMAGYLGLNLLSWSACDQLLHDTLYAKCFALLFSCHLPFSAVLSVLPFLLCLEDRTAKLFSFSTICLYMLLSRHSLLKTFPNRKKK